jgi:hypothetical protein
MTQQSMPAGANSYHGPRHPFVLKICIAVKRLKITLSGVKNQHLRKAGGNVNNAKSNS